jgi:hypothetical protein
LSFTIFDYILWVGGFSAHAVLAAVLIIKKRVPRFRIFFAGVAYQIIDTITLFLISRYGGRHAYFVAYWLFAAGDYLLQLALIFELAAKLLRSKGVWLKWSRNRFLTRAGFGVIAAAGLTAFVSPPGHSGLDLWSIRSTLFTSVLTCAVYFAMSAAANSLRKRWSHHVIAIGEGLSLWAIITLIEEVIRLALGWPKALLICDYVREVAYLISVVYWIVVFWNPDRVVESSADFSKTSTLEKRLFEGEA